MPVSARPGEPTNGSRRRLLVGAAATVACGPFGGLALADRPSRSGAPGFGPLLPDPKNLVDLPAGFSYRVVSTAGREMDDGFFVPGLADGMGTFEGADGTTIIVCNHELHQRSRSTAFRALGRPIGPEVLARIYDTAVGRGGTTTLVYDTRERRLVRQHLSLAGTLRNCAGGVTPQRSWISCEESVLPPGHDGARRAHGYCFEVPADATGLVEPVPLTAMGRFNHEAAGVDPSTGIVYLTEDRGDGLFYRFIPRTPGRLAEGGKLEALAVRDRPGVDTSNRRGAASTAARIRLDVEWIALNNVDSPADDLRIRGRADGAAAFARGEGIAVDIDENGQAAVWFACTSGGPIGAGQLWCLRPGDRGDTLELFLESAHTRLLNQADNLAVAPWGDVIVCEDNRDLQRILGVDPDGGVYVFAENARRDGEFAGACFSPDGTTMFVNLQATGITLEIQGPWS